jgi:hypothetical protein
MRVTVGTVVGLVAAGHSFSEILAAYPCEQRSVLGPGTRRVNWMGAYSPCARPAHVLELSWKGGQAMRCMFSAFTVAGLSLIAAGCSSGPGPPQPGTPAFFWSAAKTTYGAGDFLRANDSLTQLAKSDNEFSARSQPWSIMISAGIAQAYMELADNFDLGAGANRANPIPFRRQATLFRSQASAAALQGAEIVHKFLNENKADSIALELGYPTGNAAEPVQLQRVAKGMLFPGAEIEALQKAMVQRGVFLAVAHGVGAEDDVAKALEIFKAGDVKVARSVFLLATASALHDQAGLFGPKKLDQPNRLNMVCNEAEEALKSLPATKETKDLLGRIAKTRKAAKGN